MTGLVRKATLFSACGLLVAGAAFAGLPSPGNSDIPCAINVVGQNGTVASPAHTFTVVVRDGSNNPIPNSSVSIDFGNCYVGAGLGEPGPSDTQRGTSGEVDDCPTRSVIAITDVTGTVNVTVNGLSKNQPFGVTPNSACVRIFADGVLLGTVQAAAYDLDGADGITAGDLSAFLVYSLNPNCAGPTPNYCAIVDLDYASSLCSAQDVSAADLASFLTESLTPYVANGAICP